MTRTKSVLGISAALFLTAGISVAGQSGNTKPAHPVAKPAAPTQTAPRATPAAAAQKPGQPAAKATKPAAAKTETAKAAKPAAGAVDKTKPAQVAKTAKPAKAEKSAAKPEPAKTAKAEKADKKSAVKTAKVEKTDDKARPVKMAKAEKPAKGTKDKTSATASSKKVATAAAPAVPLTPVQEHLKKNPSLATKVLWRLPANTDLMAASAGFQNLGQFVAAVNVAHNLGMSFDQLKTKMITEKMPFAAAIQAVRPVASATIEVQNAEYQARGMISESEQEQAADPVPAAKVKPRKPAGHTGS